MTAFTAPVSKFAGVEKLLLPFDFSLPLTSFLKLRSGADKVLRVGIRDIDVVLGGFSFF